MQKRLFYLVLPTTALRSPIHALCSIRRTVQSTSDFSPVTWVPDINDLCTGVNGGLFCHVLVRGRMMLFVKNLMYSDCLVTTLVEDK